MLRCSVQPCVHLSHPFCSLMIHKSIFRSSSCERLLTGPCSQTCSLPVCLQFSLLVSSHTLLVISQIYAQISSGFYSTTQPPCLYLSTTCGEVPMTGTSGGRHSPHREKDSAVLQEEDISRYIFKSLE